MTGSSVKSVMLTGRGRACCRVSIKTNTYILILAIKISRLNIIWRVSRFVFFQSYGAMSNRRGRHPKLKKKCDRISTILGKYDLI